MLRRFLMNQFVPFETAWFPTRRFGKLILRTESAPPPGRFTPRRSLWLPAMAALLPIALAGLWLDQVPLLVAPLAFVGVVAASGFWRTTSVTEFREFAVIVHSDLSHVDERAGPVAVDYLWITDFRFDERGRLVLALDENAALYVPARFTRCPVPHELQRTVSRVLHMRIGKTRQELQSQARGPR